MKITKRQLRRIIRESQRYSFPLWFYYDGTHYSMSTNHSRKYYETDYELIAAALRDAKEQGYDEVIRVVGNQEPKSPEPIDNVINKFDNKSIESYAYSDY